MTDINPQIFLQFANNRSRVYLLLSQLIEKPAHDALEDLKKRLNEASFNQDDKISSCIAKIRDYLDIDDLTDLSIKLMVEHTRLFRGIKKGYGPPPPYESIYRGERNVHGETTLDVIQKYTANGFDFGVYPGPKDHIKIELLFMAYLAEQEKKARENADEQITQHIVQTQQQFLENHLLGFTQKLDIEIRKSTKNEFYSEISNLIKLYTEQDLETLNYVLQDNISS